MSDTPSSKISRSTDDLFLSTDNLAELPSPRSQLPSSVDTTSPPSTSTKSLCASQLTNEKYPRLPRTLSMSLPAPTAKPTNSQRPISQDIRTSDPNFPAPRLDILNGERSTKSVEKSKNDFFSTSSIGTNDLPPSTDDDVSSAVDDDATSSATSYDIQQAYRDSYSVMARRSVVHTFMIENVPNVVNGHDHLQAFINKLADENDLAHVADLRVPKSTSMRTIAYCTLLNMVDNETMISVINKKIHVEPIKIHVEPI